MEIIFQTKEESKKKQEEEFLSLSGSERMIRFFQLSQFFCNFQVIEKKKTKTILF